MRISLPFLTFLLAVTIYILVVLSVICESSFLSPHLPQHFLTLTAGALFFFFSLYKPTLTHISTYV